MKSRAIIFTICAVAAIMLTACNSNGEQSAVGETSDALISSSDADSEKPKYNRCSIILRLHFLESYQRCMLFWMNTSKMYD